MVFPLGPLVNAAAVIAGGLLGLALGARLPERMRTIVFQGLGLCTMVIGMQMAFKTASPVILIFSILLGGLCGESIRLEERFMRLSDRLRGRLRSDNPLFTEGLVNAAVLFCIGAMSFLGSFDEGLRGDRTLVYSKSVMDGFSGHSSGLRLWPGRSARGCSAAAVSGSAGAFCRTASTLARPRDAQ